MTKFLLILLLVIPSTLWAQFTYVQDQSIRVEEDKGTVLPTPWIGGLNAAQYNTMDLNQDGQEDLVIYDRMGDKILTFINTNKKYVYSPEYELYFPKEVSNWLLLRDFNCDGKKDIFTSDILGMKVYQNISTDALPAWKQVLFYAGPGNTKSEVLLTKGFTDKINLQLQFDDLPSISDVDGDGDLDIFTVRFVGNGTVEFHKNFGIERFGTCDSLDFERITQKWGGITECTCGEFAFNDEDCPSSGRTEHAGGKSLLAFDDDGNGQPDLLLSEATCARISSLKNSGTLLNPIVNSSEDFPFTNPASFLIYPTPYWEDLDFDGQKDLVATPNIFSKSFLNIDLSQSNWFYHNRGTNSQPDFVFAKNNFLQDQMIDVGDNAIPSFNDYDADGDFDLFVSNNNFPATVRLYENVGSNSSPSFKFKTDDYLGFSFLSYYNLKIQFADINNDKKVDLVFSATNFQNNLTGLFYVANKSSSGFDPDVQVVPVSFSMASTENICITDVDGDGVNDLLYGKSNGALEFWKNKPGSDSSPSLTLQNNKFLGIGTSVVRQNIACSAADLDGDGKVDLVLGDQTGELRIISDYRSAKNIDDAITDIIYNPLTSSYQAQNVGGRVWPVIVNLFNTTRPAITTGSVLGGLRIFRNDNGRSLPPQPLVDIYPNPVTRNGVLNIKIDRPAYIEIFSSVGHQITQPYLIQANELTPMTLPNLSAGVYMLRVTTNNKKFAKRFVVY
jgi:hypothetical protein